MNWEPRSIKGPLAEWVQQEIWAILRQPQPPPVHQVGLTRRPETTRRERTSIHEITTIMIPPSNTLADHLLRDNFPEWGRLTTDVRKEMIWDAVKELIELHRLVPKGTEKFSRYTPMLELEILDSLSRI